MKRAGRVRQASRALGMLLGGAIGVTGAAAPLGAGPPATMVSPQMTPPAPAPRMNLLDAVRPEFRDAVAKCITKPTVSTRATGDEVVCTVAVYEWLYDHPDRVALAWQRLKVPSIPIVDMGAGKFGWTDEHGSKIVWQTVGTFPDGRVWYANGKVKPGCRCALDPGARGGRLDAPAVDREGRRRAVRPECAVLHAQRQ